MAVHAVGVVLTVCVREEHADGPPRQARADLLGARASSLWPRGPRAQPAPNVHGRPTRAGEYLWNHANGTMLHDFLVNDFVMGPTGMGSQYVDGFYFE